MTNNKDFQAELQEKVKVGVKPSDLKKSKSTPSSRSAFNNEKYVVELETEKVEFLKKLANYEQEQKARVVVFKEQKKLLEEKDKQLISKDEKLSEKEEEITKLKSRIHQLFKDKKTSANSENEEEEINTSSQTNVETQTILDLPSLAEMETQIQAFQRFGKLCGEDNIDEWNKAIRKLIDNKNNYLQEAQKLFEKLQISQDKNKSLEKQLTREKEQLLEKRVEKLNDFDSYREQLQAKENEITQLKNQLKKTSYLPQYGKEKIFLLAILLIILISCLLFK